jgi:DNA-binding transcriptional MerR regulator
MGLKLWVDGEVPEGVATSVIAVLGKRGSGKTYFAGVLEEELAENGIPFIVLDPMQAHYTIREKYRVLILGGDKTPFRDAVVDWRIGGGIAELLCSLNMSAVVDLSEASRIQQERFVKDLCWKLLEVSRTPRMIVLEEADVFVPQARSTESREAVEALIRRGRAFGLGATIISQRPAIVSKDALSQSDIYLFFRLISPRDLEAVKETLDYAGVMVDDVREIISQLPRLESGEAILYSPELLKHLGKVKVRRKITSHAAETPSPESIKPIEVDFAEVAEKIREISEKVEAEESELEALRRKVREYEEKVKAMESELKIAEAVKKYIKPELVEGAVKLAELESKVRELEEKLAEEKRLRAEAEKSREEAYSIAGSSIKKTIEALEEALKKLTVSKPIQPLREQVRLPPMESRIIRYLEERRGFYIKPHILAKRIGTRVSSERFREALNRLKTIGLIREDKEGVTVA